MAESLCELMGLHVRGFPSVRFSRAFPVARRLPPTPNTAGFELPLGEGWEISDFSVGVTRADVGAGPFGRAALARRLPRETLEHPAWRTFFALSDGWDALARRGVHVQSSWLEFDCEDDTPSLLPGVFMDVTPKWRDSAAKDPEGMSAAAWEVVADIADRALTDGRSRAVRQGLDEIRRGCGAACSAFHLGLFHSRGLDTVRLCVKDVSAPVLGALASLASPETATRARELCESVGEPSDRVYLDLDVGPSVLPGIGVELHFGRRAARDRRWWDRDRWSRGLERLACEGLCLPEKVSALLAWPGGQRAPAQTGNVLFVRNLSHVKISLSPTRPPSAKAYFWFKTVPAR
ncbi:MAG: hypothetical protein ACYC6F_12955 [Longimicrobiales bacterium]